MPDFDQQLRKSLGAAAEAFQPAIARGTGEDMVVRVHERRRRNQRLTVGAACLVVIAMVAGFTNSATPGTPSHRVQALGDGRRGAPSPTGVPDDTTTTVPGSTPASPTTVVPGATSPTTAPCPVSRCATVSPPLTGGSTATSPATSNPPPTTVTDPTTVTTATTAAPAPGPITITERDNNTTVALRVGQTLRVVLNATTAMSSWSQPVASPAGVLRPQPTGITAVRGGAVAQYVGSQAGQATVHATQTPACATSTPACMIAVAPFTLKVNVS